MATSGVFTTNPEIADLVRESFERAQIKAQDVQWAHIESAIRSANFVMQDFSSKGVKAYELKLVTQLVTGGTAAYTLTEGARIFTAVLRRDNIDIPILQISREDYEDIPNKTLTGRPSELFLDPATYGVTPRTYYLWQVPENSTDIVRMWVIRRPETINKLNQDAPIAFEWQDAFCDALGLRLAKKFNPSAVQMLAGDAPASFETARMADRDRAPVRFRMSTRGRRGWR